MPQILPCPRRFASLRVQAFDELPACHDNYNNAAAHPTPQKRGPRELFEGFRTGAHDALKPSSPNA